MKNSYIRIHRGMITELKLKGNDLIIYALINGFTQQNKECFITQTRIARELNIERSTVYRSLQRLYNNNLIEIIKTNEKISYRALYEFKGNTLQDHFDIFDSMINKIKGNELLVYAYMRMFRGNTLSMCAEFLELSLQTVSTLIKTLESKGMIFKQVIRNQLGRFKGIMCHFKKCNATSNNATTDSKKCNTYNKNNNKSIYNKLSKNTFNQFMRSETYNDIDLLESCILSN